MPYRERHFVRRDTLLATSDFVLSPGWGNTAAVTSVSGTDQGWKITVTANGSGIAVNPTVTLTFKDGTWAAVPISITKITDRTGIITDLTEVATTTTDVITFQGTPTAGHTYIISSIVTGTT